MRKLLLAAAFSAATIATPAFAQDAVDTTEVSAPDGSRGFGFEPYVGILGGWENFDSEPNDAGIPQGFRNNELNGSLVQGVVGFNVPVGPLFVGAEGEVAKGVSGDIDWQYGVGGRFGFRAGETGLLFGKVGYRWTNFDRFGTNSRDYHEMTYGVGFEVGPQSIGLGGITGESGLRLRGEVSTQGDAHSFRPMLGLVTHF